MLTCSCSLNNLHHSSTFPISCLWSCCFVYTEHPSHFLHQSNSFSFKMDNWESFPELCVLNWLPLCVLMTCGTYSNKSFTILFTWWFLPQRVCRGQGLWFPFISNTEQRKCSLTYADYINKWSTSVVSWKESPRRRIKVTMGREPAGAHSHHHCKQHSFVPSFPWAHTTIQLPDLAHVHVSIPRSDPLFPFLPKLNVGGPELNYFSPEISHELPKMMLLLVSP